MTKKKIYVIDTNVIIDDPYCIDKLEGDIYIPTTVIKELDKHKYDGGQKGYHIREFSRLISKNESINIHNSELYSGTNDEKIIETTKSLAKRNHVVTLLTNDILMSLLAKAMGVATQEHDCKITVNPHIYTGITNLSECTSLLEDEAKNCQPNEYIIGAGIHKMVDGKVKRLGKDRKIWGITHKNVEQRCVIDALMDDDIRLVTISGIAGTGKTLLAIAAGLEKTIGENKYRKLLVSRPVVPMGNDIGYLPGDISEKLAPWMQPIFDNIDYLFDTKDGHKQNDQWKELEKQGLLKLEALTYIRGRSIPDQFIIIDECFPYKQKILTNKGKVSIGSLHHDFIRGKPLPKALSYNRDKDIFEYKQIKNATHKGIRKIINVYSGNKKIKCTPEHPFLTNNGWKKAEELCEKDLLLMHGTNLQNNLALNQDQLQLFVGGYLGDSGVQRISNCTVRISTIHGIKQKKYLEYKASVFQRLGNIKYIEKNGYSQTPAVQFSTLSFGIPFNYNSFKKNKLNKEIVDMVNALGLAIWFMDDGSKFTKNNGARLYTESFNLEDQKYLQKTLNKKFGLCVTILKSKGYYFLSFNKKNYTALCKIIAPYVVESMSYKVHNYAKLGGGSKAVLNNKYCNHSLSFFKKIEKIEKPVHVFDIEVKDNRNFIACVGANTSDNVSGFVVHNCQNLSKHEVKTILSRAGENTKIILTGDPDQIDNSKLSSKNNGLTYVIEKFKDRTIAAHVTLTKGERSELANIAAEIL